MSKNPKQTSDKVAHLASEILRSENASKIQKKLAGSALSQSSTGNAPSPEIETLAAKALDNPRSAKETLTLAASVVSQSTK